MRIKTSKKSLTKYGVLTVFLIILALNLFLLEETYSGEGTTLPLW